MIKFDWLDYSNIFYRWFAVDRTGVGYLYSRRPMLIDNHYWLTAKYSSRIPIGTFDSKDWQLSLQEKPDTMVNTTFDWLHPDGKPIDAVFKYFAIDSNGIGFVCCSKPELNYTLDHWTMQSGYLKIGTFNNSKWELSLLSRDDKQVAEVQDISYTIDQIQEYIYACGPLSQISALQMFFDAKDKLALASPHIEALGKLGYTVTKD